MLITRAGPYNYQPAADGPPHRHEKLRKWICNGVADLIYVRKNKVRKSRELTENAWKPRAQDRTLTELKNVSMSEVFGNYWPLDFFIIHLSRLERWGGGYRIGKSGSHHGHVKQCHWKVNQVLLFSCVAWTISSISAMKTKVKNWIGGLIHRQLTIR